MERRDKTIRSTDYDALSCRYSAVQKQYLADPYISRVVAGLRAELNAQPDRRFAASRTLKAVTLPKLPIINRGTYMRTISLDVLVRSFAASTPGRFQIISLGAGSDTRGFRVLCEYGSRVVYHEYDFAETATLKASVIRADPVLLELVGLEVKAEPDLQDSTELHTSTYHLCGIDLRGVIDMQSFPHVDRTLPTLILSECVLCYMEPQRVDAVMRVLSTGIESGAVLIYEPLGNPTDSFSQVMAANLAQRGIELPTFFRFPQLADRLNHLEGMGFTQVAVATMAYVAKIWVDASEVTRLNRLEFLDEVEEIDLLNQHYVLLVAQFGDREWLLPKPFECVSTSNA